MPTGGLRSPKSGVTIIVDGVKRADHSEGCLVFNVTETVARDLLDTLHELLDTKGGEKDGEVRATDNL